MLKGPTQQEVQQASALVSELLTDVLTIAFPMPTEATTVDQITTILLNSWKKLQPDSWPGIVEYLSQQVKTATSDHDRLTTVVFHLVMISSDHDNPAPQFVKLNTLIANHLLAHAAHQPALVAKIMRHVSNGAPPSPH
jgi:hypothetical protein